jgi:hypothetical protein
MILSSTLHAKYVKQVDDQALTTTTTTTTAATTTTTTINATTAITAIDTWDDMKEVTCTHEMKL